MIQWVNYLAICCFCLSGSVAAQHVKNERLPVVPVGYDAFRMWQLLPQQRIGVRAYMRSTYDRGGGSADASNFLFMKKEDENVTLDVLDFFIQKTAALKALGINDLIIDPGFGFGKTNRHNFTLIKNLQVFSILGYPVLLGVSRKGTIYKTLGVTADEALNGTTVLNTIGLLNGACVLRVHDVKEATEVIRLYERYQNS